MLLLQHLLCGAIAWDPATFRERAAALAFPDAIRAYSKKRQYSHFERSADGADVSWWRFPADMGALDGASVAKSLEADAHLAAGIRPCALGEETDLAAFRARNAHLRPPMYAGIEAHLLQDRAFDGLVRSTVDCSRMYEDVFVVDGSPTDGAGVRARIGAMETQGILLLAERLFEDRGEVCGKGWVDSCVAPLLMEAWPADLARTTLGFLAVGPVVEAAGSTRTWVREASAGPLPVGPYGLFLEGVVAVTRSAGESQGRSAEGS